MLNPYDFIDFTGNKNYVGLTSLQCWEKLPDDLKFMIIADHMGRKLDAVIKAMGKIEVALTCDTSNMTKPEQTVTVTEGSGKPVEGQSETAGKEVAGSSPSGTPA